MSEPTVAPYGEWISPIRADDLAAGTHAPIEAAYCGDQVWWSESVAAEGRVALFGETPAGPALLLPAPWSARSRVHEYGGGAWAAFPASGERAAAFVFVESSDGRLYRVDVPGSAPVPLSPPDSAVAHGGLIASGDTVLAVRERSTGPAPTDVVRDLVRVPIDGSAADAPLESVSLVAASRFLAQPALSPDGEHLAWIAWEHPAMPWDATELRVGRIERGRVRSWRTIAGGPSESVLQPEWLADGTLAFLSDRTGWWNLYRADPNSTAAPERLLAAERETGGPLWVLGTTWYLPLSDGRIALTSTLGSDDQLVLDPATGVVDRVATQRSRTEWQATQGTRVLVIDAAADAATSLRELDLGTGRARVVRSGIDDLPLEFFPPAHTETFAGVHAVRYPPFNPEFQAPAGELPPYVVFVHGGPTAHAAPALKPAYAYYTSRGIGVIDVNYGGSTGYGRPYRDRLRGSWGVVDVADVGVVAHGLAAAGLADPARIAIEGGSAGGWTVLAALEADHTFAAGISRFGVSDPVTLATDTHDFESRYLDGLVGPYPEAAAIYAERAPINHVDRLTSPVLLLQGSDDRVVPPAQSTRLRDALAAQGVVHAYLEFPGEGHGFRGRDAIVRSAEASVSFLGQVLGFAPPGVPVLPLES